MIHVCEPSIIIDLYGVHLHDLLDVLDLAPPFVVFVAAVVSVASVATAVCDQVVTVQHVDDIDEVHQLDPVHQVDHKDELWGDPGANFWCFFFEIITFCALVGAIFIFSSKSSIFGPLALWG